ncbi:MAG: hypothetical protein U9R38_06425 [Candidatus Margulisiibacteriota bacterium]|nr:hypothetical protein [Candidatus Margulisiibacteriota bacterium]
MRRIILPAALALATVSVTACKTREQAAKRYLEKCGTKPTPALINKYSKLARPRWFNKLRGFYINDKCLPNVVVRERVVEKIKTVKVPKECPMCPTEVMPQPDPKAPDRGMRPSRRRRRRRNGRPKPMRPVDSGMKPAMRPGGMIEI